MKANKRSEAETRKIVVRFQAAGIPIPLAAPSATKPDLVVESLAGSFAFDLRMGSEYLLFIEIFNHSFGDLLIEKVRGHLLGEQLELSFQGEPTHPDPERKTYRMLSGREVGCNLALHPRLGNAIAAGTSVKGALLAYTITDQIPGKYLHGGSVSLKIILTDQYGRKHRSVFEVLVDRTTTMPPPTFFRRVAGSLYGGSCPPPPEFDHSLKARQMVEKGHAGRSTESTPDLIKRVAAV